ncbi:S-adenosyl-L-methionine-dependent methyltransferase, partial [Viridothelium virens]
MSTEVEAIINRLTLLKGDGELTENATAQTEALHLSKQLQFALQKPEDAALELSFWPSYAFCARLAIDLDLFKLISDGSGTVSSGQLASASGGEELLIIRILRGLSAIGFVKEVEESRWAATPLTRAMAIPPVAAGHVHFWDQGVGTMASMPQYFRINGYRCPTDPLDGSFQYAFQTKQEAFSYWHQFPSILGNFNTFMQGVRGSRPQWIEWFPVRERILAGFEERQDAVLLIDVAGGRGHDVEAFKHKFSEVKGKLILQDLPAVISDIKTLDEDIQRQEYDFFTPQTIQGARVYFFHFIFHDWSDEACLKILSNTVSAMKKGYSKILLNEFILPDRGCPLLPIGMDLNMMAMHAGQERTENQWRALLVKAGLEPTFWFSNGGAEGIIEAHL